MAIASYTLKNLHTNNFSQSTQNNLPGPGHLTGPHRILSCPTQKICPQFSSEKTENSLAQKKSTNFPLLPMDVHCLKKPKSQFLPNLHIFVISSSKLLKQLARAGHGQALVLTICSKLAEFKRTFFRHPHLVGRELVPELGHHEHPLSTFSKDLRGFLLFSPTE